jgi:hypothetical protein
MEMTEILLEQLERTWGMVAELIEACPDEEWRKGDSAYFVPGCQLYHLLDCAQCLCGNPPTPPPTPKTYGPHWEAAGLPTREQLRGMLEKARGDARAWISGYSDEELGTRKVRNRTVLEQIVYAIRHNQYHVAVVNAEMRRRGLPRMAWK